MGSQSPSKSSDFGVWELISTILQKHGFVDVTFKKGYDEGSYYRLSSGISILVVTDPLNAFRIYHHGNSKLTIVKLHPSGQSHVDDINLTEFDSVERIIKGLAIE